MTRWKKAENTTLQRRRASGARDVGHDEPVVDPAPPGDAWERLWNDDADLAETEVAWDQFFAGSDHDCKARDWLLG